MVTVFHDIFSIIIGDLELFNNSICMFAGSFPSGGDGCSYLKFIFMSKTVMNLPLLTILHIDQCWPGINQSKI